MALILSPSKNLREIRVFNILGDDAKVGRWCSLREYPDRCNCIDPETGLNLVATHYYVETVPGHGGKKTHYRHGACPRCLDQHPDAKPIPPQGGKEN